MRIGILSSGGDSPGINATIRAIGKTAMASHDMEVFGFRKGFTGILNKDFVELDMDSLSGLLHAGGTMLGTSRDGSFRKKLQKDEDVAKAYREAYDELGLDAIIAIGGNGTMKTAAVVSKMGMNVIGIPKTIDNDVWGTDQTFGFDTAVAVATEAIDRLHSTAESHGRVMVVEVMGHTAGWIALHAGMAGGADVILLPEFGYDIDIVRESLLKRQREGRKHSIVVVAEGLEMGEDSAAQKLCKELEKNGDIECRQTVLGYVQRGGAPCASDRNLCTLYGGYATQLIDKGKFGVMVALVNNEITTVPLKEVAGKLKLVEPDNRLVIQGKRMDICFGTK